tara:strand:+ start:381 stop:1235 length:855 start_codon:yes stop_codon:yes gene_type:complete
MQFRISSLSVLVLVLIFTGCRKDKDEDQSANIEATRDFYRAEHESNQLSDIGEEAVGYSTEDPSGKRSLAYWYLSSCATVTVSPAWPDTTFPKTIEVDFGSGCTGMDGRYRTGNLTIVATGRYRTPGSSYTVTSSNYTVDGYLIQGTKTVTNTGYNSNNYLVYTIDMDGYITKPDSTVISYSSDRIRKWVAGINTNLYTHGVSGRTDDVYWITGDASGQSSNGTSYTADITDQLVIELDCQYITSGTLEIQPNSAAVRTIDWGNGNCDNQATVSVNGYTATISL